MTFGKRVNTALLSAVIAALIGSLLFLILSEAVRTITITVLIMSAVIFGIALVVGFVMEGKPSKIRVPIYALLVVLSVIIVSSYMLYNVGKRITLPGSSDEDSYEDLCDLEAGVEQISSNGLSGWRIIATSVPENEPRPVILYFGGNGENSSGKVAKLLDNEKLSFLYEYYDFVFIDYPTYGLSEGPLNESTLQDFTVQAYEIVSSMDTTSGITLMSYSIGNGPAMYLASREDVDIDSMIMLAPYNSGYDLFNNYLNIFHGPLKLLVAYKLPAYRYAQDVECPVTMIASVDDEVIPIESSRALFSSVSSGSANFITVNGIDHNSFFSSPDVIVAIMNCLEVR